MSPIRRAAAILLALFMLLAPLSGLAQTVSAPFTNLSGARVSAAFEYDDSLFAGKDTKLNPALAIASVSLAASAQRTAYVRDALEQMGFSSINTYDYDVGSWTAQDNDYAAHALARKSITLGDKTYTLYAVAVSGTQGYDWVSNFNVGEGSEHAGFSAAATRVMNNIAAYVDTPAQDSLFWVCGHSRGAAVGNIVGARLTAGNTGAKVFCYTSATPATTRKKNLYGKGSMKNLIALNNPADYITRIPLAAWNYRVYGRTITLPNQGKVFNRMKTAFSRLAGTAYAGQTVKTAQRMVQETRKYSPNLKRYTSGATFKNGQGTHCPNRYFSGLALVLAGGAERQQALTRMLEEVGASQYAVNLTALMLGLKLPCSRERLTNYLINLNPQDPLGAMAGIAHAHTPEAYVAWVNALYA